MEKIITIKPLDIREVRVEKASPITNRRSKVSREKVLKFENFKESRKGAIDEQELLAIKPELNVEKLSQYEENLSLDRLLSKIKKINKILRKYGYVNLCISPDNIKELFKENSEVEKPTETNNLIPIETEQLVPVEEKIKEMIPVESPNEEVTNSEDKLNELMPFDELDNDEFLEDERKLVA